MNQKQKQLQGHSGNNLQGGGALSYFREITAESITEDNDLVPTIQDVVKSLED